MVTLPKITLSLVMLFVMLFLFINAPLVYGVYAEPVKTTLIAYFILLIMVTLFSRGELFAPLTFLDLRNFAVMFFVTTFVFIPLQFLSGLGAEVAVTTALGFGLLHGFIKAFIEEEVWADKLKKLIGPWGSAITFGIFHLSVTAISGGVNYIAILLLAGLRLVWDKVYDRFGVMGSTGSHFAYNAAVMGLKII